MGHSIQIEGYTFPDNIHSLEITFNLSEMYDTAINNAGYDIVSFGEFIDGKKMKDLRDFFKDMRYELETHPDIYESANPPNGFGSYDSLLRNLGMLVVASYKHPEGILEDCY